MGSHGGYCGPAVKPIALNMVARSPAIRRPRLADFRHWRCRHPGATLLTTSRLGLATVQVCTAAMVYGFKIVQEMIDGLSNYMDAMGFASIDDFKGRAVPTVTDWKNLNLNHISKAVINQSTCIQCGRCHIACEDTSVIRPFWPCVTANGISK
jgi:dihydropyrimidine dehydrogenase (NAD+) subunit PreA